MTTRLKEALRQLTAARANVLETAMEYGRIATTPTSAAHTLDLIRFTYHAAAVQLLRADQLYASVKYEETVARRKR